MRDVEAEVQRVLLDAYLVTAAAAFRAPDWYVDVQRAHDRQEACYWASGDHVRAELFQQHSPVIEDFDAPPSCLRCSDDSDDDEGRLPVFPCPVLRRAHGSDEVWSSLIDRYRSAWADAAPYYRGWNWQPIT